MLQRSSAFHMRPENLYTGQEFYPLRQVIHPHNTNKNQTPFITHRKTLASLTTNNFDKFVKFIKYNEQDKFRKFDELDKSGKYEKNAKIDTIDKIFEFDIFNTFNTFEMQQPFLTQQSIAMLQNCSLYVGFNANSI